MRISLMGPRHSPLRGAVLGAQLILTGCGDSGATTAGQTNSSSTTATTAETTTGPVPTTGTTGDDSSTSQMTTGEPTTTGSTGDSSTGDSTTGDSSTGDSTTGDGSTDTTEGVEGSSSSSTGDSSTGEPIDCDALPQGPLPYTVKPGPRATEDFAFDDQGNLLGAQAGNLFKTPFDGPPQLWLPGAGGFIAGLRATSKGMVVYADNDSATLFRVNDGGGKEMVLAGLDYANGLEVDLDGFVYVAEQDGGRVRRIDPATGQNTTLADDLYNPNGVSFAPDYRTLYVGSFGGGTITAITLNEDMTPASVELFRENIGNGELDGMAVDACGNIYVCEYVDAIVWRITPDGQSIAPLVQLGQETGWIPNLQWGSGIGGWERETLYVLDAGTERVFEVPVGVPDKKRGYP